MKKIGKILTADDSAFMRKVLIDILKEAGAEVIIEASNGREAVEKFHSEKPDLVLMDIIMPEMDGMEALKSIGKEAKVIMITAVGQEGVINEAKEHGAAGYILKPFDKVKVVEEITKVMG